MTVTFAAPVGLFALGRVAAGETLLGIVLLGIAVGMIVVQRYVVTPADLVARAVQGVVGAAVEDPTETGDSGEE